MKLISIQHNDILLLFICRELKDPDHQQRRFEVTDLVNRAIISKSANKWKQETQVAIDALILGKVLEAVESHFNV